jgi:predicted PurR-regulated permease PerM
VPLPDHDRDRLFDKFLSVTRATLKGTLVIGAVQGMLGGLAFWVLGISGAIFWGVVMVVFSVLPVVGGALVWVPAAIMLALSGQFVKAIVLVVFCGLVVGSVDNVLRPRLVGRDTEMHDLMILFSTLGGIMAFGAVGFILGPIIAALFQTVWELMDVAFNDILPHHNVVAAPVVSATVELPVSADETSVEG